MAAAKALSDRGMAPAMLIGHSLGGAAVLKAAGQIDSVKAVVTIGAPFDPGHVTHNFGDALTRIDAGHLVRDRMALDEDEMGALVAPLALVAALRERYYLVILDTPPVLPVSEAAAIGKLGASLLVLHAPLDAIVSIDNASQIFLAAKHPKSFVTLDDADHLITNPADAEYAAEVIAAWAGRYLKLAPPAPPAEPRPRKPTTKASAPAVAFATPKPQTSERKSCRIAWQD